MRKYTLASLLGLLCFIISCHHRHAYLLNLPEEEKKVYRVMPQAMREGDPVAGYEYMIYGDYVGNGIPYEVFKQFFKPSKDTVLQREGLNANLPYAFTAFESWYGEPVVSGNCFTCHAAPLNGELVLGLGNPYERYNKDIRLGIRLINWRTKKYLGADSPEWEAYREHGEWVKAVAAAIIVDNPGVNPALRIEEATLAYRASEDLSFQDSANFEIPRRAFGADVPPLWHLNKKHALYYNGMGRGDFTKLLMQACLLGIHDSTHAREVQTHFDDVIAWINTLEPPKYPKPIDQPLAAKGKLVFEDQCSKCHGTYGDNPTYPNKLVPLDEIGTDPYYALYALQSPANAWYNQSWFRETSPQAESKPSYAYMAPPLDGLWATAPYFHNGSVPTVAAVLDSRQRPTHWKRPAPREEAELDYEHLGWKVKTRSLGWGKGVYNTQKPGYGNQGHYFGDSLREEDRRALLEYLKTL